jgi:polysaccharide transporter, PST family
MLPKTNRRLISNFISLTIVQGTNFLLPLIVMPFVIRWVGAAGFGVISVAHVVMVYLSTIADYGFNLTATRDLALHKTDGLKISKIFSTVLLSKMLITAASFPLLLLLVMVIPIFKANLPVYLFGFVYVIGQSLLVSWFFQGLEKMHYITIITLLSRLIFVVLVFLFIRQKEDSFLFLFFLGVGNIIAGLLSIFLAIRIFRLRLIRPRWNEIAAEFRDGWPIMLSNLSINTYLYTNVFILRLFTNDLVVGYYSIAEKIFFAFRQILGIFSQVIYPRVCQMAMKSKEQLGSFFSSFYLPFLWLVIAVSLSVFIFSPQIVEVFLSERPELPVLLLQILSLVPVIVCLNIPAFQLLLAFNQKRSYSSVLGLGTIVNIVANLVLCKAFGAVGTAVSIIVTELFITVGLNLQLNRNKLRYLIRRRTI